MEVCKWAKLFTFKEVTKCEKCELNDCCPHDKWLDDAERSMEEFLDNLTEFIEKGKK